MIIGFALPPSRPSPFAPEAPCGTYYGSAYKIGELVAQVADLMVLNDEQPGVMRAQASLCDVLLVKGDHDKRWLAARKLGAPYIVLVNDVATMRDPSFSPEVERTMLEGAVGLIFVTGPLQEYCRAHYDLPPHTLVPLRPLRRDMDFEPRSTRRKKTLVYAGGLVEWSMRISPWGYRAYAGIFDAARRGGWEVHVYPAIPRRMAIRELQMIGHLVHVPMPEQELPRELSSYTAMLQGYNVEDVPAPALEDARLAWPNKTWLGLCAGIPTIGVNPGWESGRIFTEGGWGVVLNSLEEFATLDPRALPAITQEMREANVAEHSLPDLRRLLSELDL